MQRVLICMHIFQEVRLTSRLALLSKLVLALQLKFRQDVLALYLHEVDLLLNEDCAHLTVWES